MKTLYYLLAVGFMSMSLFAMQDNLVGNFDTDDIDYKSVIEVKIGEDSNYKARTKSGFTLLCKVIREYNGEDTFGPRYIAKSCDCSIDYGQFIHKLNEDDSSKAISKIVYSIKNKYMEGFNR